MSRTPETIPTRNEAWGFFGTVDRMETGTPVETATAWSLASEAIATATGVLPEGIRDFLDSRYGRHFADDVANGLIGSATLTDAIGAATARWMGWSIDRRTSRDTGIPAGLPYLTGFAAHFEILAEEADA